MNRKIRFYLYIVGLLWLGAAAKSLTPDGAGGQEQSIEAVLLEESYAGRLSREEKEALAGTFFAEKKAEPVQTVMDAGMFSAYGYSPLLQDYVVSDGKRINLNMTAVYDEEAAVTRVILASPIYNEDF